MASVAEAPADPADALFAAPLAEFVATRGRLASELAKAGDKQAAAALKAIGKPSVSAWAVNQAVRAEPAAVHRLIRGQRRPGAGPAERRPSSASAIRRRWPNTARRWTPWSIWRRAVLRDAGQTAQRGPARADRRRPALGGAERGAPTGPGARAA